MFIPDPNFFHLRSRIQGQKDPGSGSTSKGLNIFNPKIVSKLSEIWSGAFLPDPYPGSGSWFFTHPGSGSATLTHRCRCGPQILRKQKIQTFTGTWMHFFYLLIHASEVYIGRQIIFVLRSYKMYSHSLLRIWPPFWLPYQPEFWVKTKNSNEPDPTHWLYVY